MAKYNDRTIEEYLGEALIALERQINCEGGSRELSLVKTKLEEAQMWLERAEVD